MRDLLIVGAGGHAREVLWLASRAASQSYRIRLAVESGWETPRELGGVPVENLDAIEPSLSGTDFVIAIADSKARERIAHRLSAAGASPTVLIDPSVKRSDSVKIGSGSVICAGSILTCDIVLGCHVHINAGCLIHHDARISNFATVSPGVRIAGHVEIGHHAFIGVGATIINGSEGSPLYIGAGAVVAAGSCVTNDVMPGSMVAGVPAVRKR